MTIEYDVLELDEIVTELTDVGETISDLSLVRFELVNDTHWDCLDMRLELMMQPMKLMYVLQEMPAVVHTVQNG